MEALVVVTLYGFREALTFWVGVSLPRTASPLEEPQKPSLVLPCNAELLNWHLTAGRRA